MASNEYLVRGTRVFLSKNTEGTVADPATNYNAEIPGLTANYLRAVMTSRTFLIPQLEFIDDLGKIGTGFEQASTLRPDYWTQPVFTLGEDANTENMALMLIRALSGPVTSGLVATMPDGTTPTPTGGPTEHICLMQQDSAGRQLVSFNVVTQGAYKDDTDRGFDMKMTGCVVDSIQMGQNQGELPTWSAEIVGSGKYITPSGLVLASGVNQIPDLVDQSYIGKSTIGLVYSNPAKPSGQQLINLSALGRVRSWNFQYNNNVRRVDQRIGDPLRVSNDPTSGGIINHTEHGNRTCSFQVVVSTSHDLSEFLLHRDNIQVQNIILTLRGNLFAGSGLYAAQAAGVQRHNVLVEVTIPRSYVRGISNGDQNDESVLTLDFFPVRATQSQEYVTARILNGHTSYYPLA